MRTVSLAIGALAFLGSGYAIAQTPLPGAPAPYVPEGYQPIEYSPPGGRTTVDPLPAYRGDAIAAPLPGPAIPEGGYVSTTLVPGGDAEANRYRIEDLQADFDSSIPAAIYFEFDKSDVTEDAATILMQQAEWLKRNPEATVHLTGHADAVGANAYNYRLGLRRAESTAAYLVDLGVELSRMKTVVSKGEEDLAVPTERREQLNRRVITRVTGVRRIPLPAPVVAAPPPPPPPPQVRRLPPPPPAAPPQPAPIQRAQIPEYTPPPRTYAPEPPICQVAAVDPGEDLQSLRQDLEVRMNRAIDIYNDPAVVTTNSPLYFWAHHTKAQCGLAVGYTKSGTRDLRSIGACRCGTQQMAHYQGAGR